jgi:hypothetical protein
MAMNFFHKGNQYYRISSNSLAVDRGYPRPLSHWSSKLTTVDSATAFRGKTYFFKGNKHYLYDDRTNDVSNHSCFLCFSFNLFILTCSIYKD